MLQRDGYDRATEQQQILGNRRENDISGRGKNLCKGMETYECVVKRQS